MGVTYDTGALVAADRGERRQWARHRALLNHREVPVVPAPVLAQAWRGGSRQALLSRLLTGCDTETLDDTRARATGALAARSATTDIVDACVVEGALRRHDLIISSDPGDLQAIAAAISQRLEIDHPYRCRPADTDRQTRVLHPTLIRLGQRIAALAGAAAELEEQITAIVEAMAPAWSPPNPASAPCPPPRSTSGIVRVSRRAGVLRGTVE